MESRIKIFGHPVHPMLIVFPLGLLATSVIFDIIYLSSDNTAWAGHSYVMIAAGVISGVIAAVFGILDFRAIPSDTRAKNIGAIHGIGNVFVIGLFLASWLVRRDLPSHVPNVVALSLSSVAFLLALVTGWLGGELVDRLGVGVDEGANPNAPSSLKVSTLQH
jgi:uncharacterized membrane protein